MATVSNKRHRDIESMLRQFRKEVEAEDILGECKRRKYFVKDSRIKHEKSKKEEYKRKKKKSQPLNLDEL